MTAAHDPRPLPPDDGDGRRPPDPYTTPFTKWDDVSWVRTGQRRDHPFSPGLVAFSRGLSFLLRADGAQHLDPDEVRLLLTHELLTYLQFTVDLELGPVNEACRLIQSPFFLPFLPAPMKADARRVYTDEGGHAEMTGALIRQACEHAGIAVPEIMPQFMKALEAIVADESPQMRSLVLVAFVSISETLITGSLKKLPNDEEVQVAVREVVRDHARDEAKHHAYFKQFFSWFWWALPAPHRRRLGVLLPRMILAFLEPDQGAAVAALASLPDRFPDPRRTVCDLLDDPETRDRVAASARSTLGMLTANHVFDDPYVVDAFVARGLHVAGGAR